MKKLSAILLSSLMLSVSPLLFAATAAHTTDPDPTIASIESEDEMANVREKLKSMTPQQRKAMMTNAKKKWDSLPDADKQAFRAKAKDRVEKIKTHMAKRQQEMMDNNGEKIYVRLYAIEQVK